MTMKWIYVVDKAELNNMNEDGNDVIDNKVERNNALQGNIDFQLLENLSVEEALAFFSS